MGETVEMGAPLGTIQHPGKIAFLEAFSRTGIVKLGVAAAGIERTTHYKWLEDDAVYAAAFAQAKEDAADTLEAEAHRRGVEGVDKPVTVAGIREVVKVHSDDLLKMLLAANRPEKYRAITEHRHTGPNGGAIQIDVRADARAIIMNPEALELVNRLAELVFSHVDKPDVEALPEGVAVSPQLNGHANGSLNGHAPEAS